MVREDGTENQRRTREMLRERLQQLHSMLDTERERSEYLRRVLEDIAKGRWNTGSRYLATKDSLTPNEYARAALRGVRPYEGRPRP